MMNTGKKTLLAGLAVLFAVLPFAAPCRAGGGVGWGLSYPVPGGTPRGMADRESLLEHDSYFAGDGGEKVIYLTFDAGFENGYTETVLDTLKQAGIPAAFFLVGTYIRDNPDLIRRMVSEGHIVANHTMTHPDMSAISDIAVFRRELSQVEELYRGVTGRDMPKYYRPPRGVYSEENLKMAKQLGYKTIFWSCAYVDWNVDNQPRHEEAFSKLMPRTHPGMVLLLHNTSKTNAEILEALIGKYQAMGYRFGTLDDLTA
ncbi:MAG: polysaccharide deacetylase family protein [Oscillospiraceae bacterium]|nr:polysaccharide deacetylase family protein [Oscillospiraceae bacterium]